MDGFGDGAGAVGNKQGGLVLRTEHDIGESVRSLDVGVVSTPGYVELVACTYSGRVVSLTTEPLSDTHEDDKYGRSKAIVGKEAQVKAFRSELKDLQKQVTKEAEKLQKLRPGGGNVVDSGSGGGGGKRSSSSSSSDNLADCFIAMESQFSVNHSFELMDHDATYQLVMEIPIPISQVVLQTTVPVDLLQLDSEAPVIMSRTNAAIGGYNDDAAPLQQVLATYRPAGESSMRRMKIGLRSVEGQYGELFVYVVSGATQKTAHVLRLGIKPLSMHARINGFDESEEGTVPWNELKFTGKFSIGQAHGWVSFCLPSIPPHVTADSVSSHGTPCARLCFRNAFVGSHLICTYQDGEAVFRSDSVTTITILKQVITKQATNLNQNVNVSTRLNRESVPRFLQLIHPKLEEQFRISRQMQLSQAMDEMTDLGADTSYLEPELQYVVKHQAEIRKTFAESKRILEILYGMITDLYIDVKQQTSGQHASTQVPLLMQLLQNYDVKAVEKLSWRPSREAYYRT